MTRLDLLLPFALPPQEMARDLLRELKTPALAMLLARGNRLTNHLNEDFSRALPHESWLARQYGLSTPSDNSSPALATSVMRAFDLPAQSGFWFIVQPVHLHIARDHLVLTDPRHLALSEPDSRALFDIVRPLLEETGKTLQYGDAATWFLRADDWHALLTSTPDAASGHNIDIWMPKGDQARDWRRLQNEIQMHWHAHAINDEREARGLKPVNSIWLWGGASATGGTQPEFEETFTSGASGNPFIAAAASPVAATSATDILARPQHGLLMLDDLIAPALAGDWSEWLGRFQAMEQTWFAPLLDALGSGRLDRLSLTLSHNTMLSTFAIGKSSLRRFWKKPSLARLAA